MEQLLLCVSGCSVAIRTATDLMIVISINQIHRGYKFICKRGLETTNQLRMTFSELFWACLEFMEYLKLTFVATTIFF